MLRLVIWPSTMYDAFRVNRDQVMDHEIWFKIHTNMSLILRQCPPKSSSLFKFYDFCDTLSFFQIVGTWWDFTVLTKPMKHFKSLNGFGGHSQIRGICMDFEPYFKVHSLVSVHPKSIMLRHMTNINMIFHMLVWSCEVYMK